MARANSGKVIFAKLKEYLSLSLSLSPLSSKKFTPKRSRAGVHSEYESNNHRSTCPLLYSNSDEGI